jgi:hypothetical protein
MSFAYKGGAVVETAVGALDAYAGVTNEALKAAHAWEEEIIKDASGLAATWVPRDEHVILDVTVKLTGASVAAAKAASIFLAPYAPVVLSGFDLSWMNATWQYIGGTAIDLSDSKHGGATIKLRKYANSAQQTAATTAVTYLA